MQSKVFLLLFLCVRYVSFSNQNKFNHYQLIGLTKRYTSRPYYSYKYDLLLELEIVVWAVTRL